MKITQSAAQLFILQPLPHTSFLLLARAATSIIFVTTKRLLSQQKYACHDKTFLLQHVWQIFVATNVILSGQTCVCCILSWQKFCHDKHTFVMTKDMFCPWHVFVTTKLLSWQKLYLWQLQSLILFFLFLFFFSYMGVCRWMESKFPEKWILFWTAKSVCLINLLAV